VKRIPAGKAGDLPPGGSKAVAAGDGEIAVFNAGGSYHAMDNACPHRGGPLSEGRLDGCVVVCPWHGWQFDVTDGSLLMNPASKQKTYKVVKEGDDLFVEI
jgi:nitrite reductase/ring-hydroxylating ferredoxin subunit